jgi:hypothetical protein
MPELQFQPTVSSLSLSGPVMHSLSQLMPMLMLMLWMLW